MFRYNHVNKGKRSFLITDTTFREVTHDGLDKWTLKNGRMGSSYSPRCLPKFNDLDKKKKVYRASREEDKIDGVSPQSHNARYRG